MDYGALLRRSWEIVWNNKWLILLGVLVALGSGGGGGGSGTNYQFPGGNTNGNFNGNDNFNFDPNDFQGFPGIPQDQLNTFLAIGLPIMIALICVGVLIGVVFWVVSRVASGGLIAGVDQLDSGMPSSFGIAWSAGWARVWRLLGVGLVASIPGLVMALIILALLVPIFMNASTADQIESQLAGGGLVVTLIVLACLTVLVSIPLALLRGLADRAAMLEDTGVFDSYRRAWAVVRDNFGEALILALIHFGAQLVIGLFLFLPTVILSCCCIFWPVIWGVNGAITSYFSTMWTLAWRQWTNRARPLTGPAADVAPPAPPAPAEPAV